MAIARALIAEPTSALDVSVQAEILNLLSDLRAAKNLTYVLVNHNLAVITHLSPRLGVMQFGEMVEILSAEDLRAGNTKHPHTTELRQLSISLEEPGGAIICFDENGVKFAHTGGLESLSTRTPFSVDTVVRYASVTKHVFSAMVLQHSDIIKLDDCLGQHLPELQAPLSEVTIGQALDMTGGLPDTRECLTLLGLSVYTETEAKRLMEFLATFTRLNFEAGTEISYSNTGYRLVETILKRHGFLFNDFVEKKIATALGVFLTAPNVWNDTVLDLAPSCWHNSTKWQLSAAGLHISASGSLAGSAKALAA